ncbi:S8 family serine peptidase [Kitasatospora sp. A2-31]|nr:S8 family serine peptidase [Kitasatospora sp. A2-31]
MAVLDSGVNQDHQDLLGQVLAGADLTGGKSDGRLDTDGHGTAMASLIAGTGHGSQAGIVGLAPKAKILPIKIRSTEGLPEAQQSDLAQAIRFAADHGAKVINMSLGGYSGSDPQTREAIKYAISKEIVLVASAGNSGDKAAPVEYPAAYPGVVAVAAVDERGQVWEKSTFGPETTISAPGVGIYHASAKSTSGYTVGNGTSDAAAYTSAVIALVRSKYPNLSAGQVINRMIKSASPPADGSAVPNAHYGYGVVDPAKALEPNPGVDGGPKENPLLGRGESQGAPASGDPTDDASAVPPVDVPVAGAEGNPGITYTLLGAGGLGVLVVAGVVVGLLVRSRRRAAAAAAYPPPPAYPYPGAQPPPQQAPPYQ